MIENIEDVHQFAVILVDLIDLDTQYLSPNDIFQQPSPVCKTRPERGLNGLWSAIHPSHNVIDMV